MSPQISIVKMCSVSLMHVDLCNCSNVFLSFFTRDFFEFCHIYPHADMNYLNEFSFSSSDPETIVKVGEGTYGEAFKIGSYVCKIVPIDGDLRVNGEIQKVTLAFILFLELLVHIIMLTLL